ncbi:DUF3954 domain-containing protein [Alkalihalobacillus deserti]|nr:DUF3954 domain-containing protein [Alkalihalobacillus deserti]
MTIEIGVKSNQLLVVRNGQVTSVEPPPSGFDNKLLFGLVV